MAVLLTEQEPVEHESLEVSTQEGVSAYVRRVVELVHEQVQHRPPAAPQRTVQVGGEVEDQSTSEGAAQQLLELRLQAGPRDHQAQLLTVGRPRHLGGRSR
jgi:hypothetical protein